MKVLFLVTEDWYFLSHRLALARATRDAGAEVLVMTRLNEAGPRLEAEGFRVIPWSSQRQSLNPLRELRTLSQVIGAYRRHRPDLVHHVAVKPIILGSIAAKLTGVAAQVNLLAGFGSAFATVSRPRRRLGRLLEMVMRAALRGPHCHCLTQNEADQAHLRRLLRLRPENIHLLPGSGVDPDEFPVRPEPGGPPVLLFASRLLWSKGIGDFMAAVQDLRAQGLAFEAWVAGAVDHHNPEAVGAAQLDSWRQRPEVRWLGRVTNMPDVISRSAVVVLPTYNEGAPRILIEAAAAGRPIVATDIPGCRQIVQPEGNGLLVPPGSVTELAAALRRLILDPGLRCTMGHCSRQLFMARFTEAEIIARTHYVYELALQQPFGRHATA